MEQVEQTKEAPKAPEIRFEGEKVRAISLGRENLAPTLDMLRKTFPEVGSTEESFEQSLPASLDPDAYGQQLQEWGISAPKYWVAEAKGKTLGTTGLYRKLDEPQDVANIGWFGVAQEARGMGVGPMLLNDTIRAAQQQGVRELRVYSTSVDDPRGHALYEKFGFKVASEQVAPEGYTILNFSKRLDNLRERSQAEKLMDRSKFKRDDPGNPNTTIEKNGERFSISSIENTEHPDFQKAYDLFVKAFKAEEVDSPETIQKYMAESDMLLHAVKNDKEEVVCALLGYRSDIHDEGGSLKQALGIDMITTDERYAGKGLAREAYISAALRAEQGAKADSKELSMAMGECTYSSEKFWNSVGWKRAYAVEKDTKTIREIKYYQPPVDFNKDTGLAEEGKGEVPEHFMVDSLERKTPPTKEEIADIGRKWLGSFEEGEEFFSSPEAYAAHQAMMEKYVNDFVKQLEGAERVVVLDSRNRQRLIDRGWKFETHDEADGHEAGKEDF